MGSTVILLLLPKVLDYRRIVIQQMNIALANPVAGLFFESICISIFDKPFIVKCRILRFAFRNRNLTETEAEYYTLRFHKGKNSFMCTKNIVSEISPL
jgi:hypothetical protein